MLLSQNRTITTLNIPTLFWKHAPIPQFTTAHGLSCGNHLYSSLCFRFLPYSSQYLWLSILNYVANHPVYFILNELCHVFSQLQTLVHIFLSVGTTLHFCLFQYLTFLPLKTHFALSYTQSHMTSYTVVQVLLYSYVYLVPASPCPLIFSEILRKKEDGKA